MGRKMVKMEKITNEKTRITTYKRRKATLYKMADEFSKLCDVETCLIVYGPNKIGDEIVVEPELWPKDERKVRQIITKYRKTVSSACTKTHSLQECLEKNKIKVVKSKNVTRKYHPWDKKLDKCSFNELYAVFSAVENKIQEATNRSHRVRDSTSWSNEQLGLFGYNQMFPQPTMDHNGFSFIPFDNQISSNTAEMASFSNVTDPMMTTEQDLFYRNCLDGSFGPEMVHRTAYMEPRQWDLGNDMVNNMKQLEPRQWDLGNGMVNNMKEFSDYSTRFAQVNNLVDSSNRHNVEFKESQTTSTLEAP